MYRFLITTLPVAIGFVIGFFFTVGPHPKPDQESVCRPLDDDFIRALAQDPHLRAIEPFQQEELEPVIRKWEHLRIASEVLPDPVSALRSISLRLEDMGFKNRLVLGEKRTIVLPLVLNGRPCDTVIQLRPEPREEVTIVVRNLMGCDEHWVRCDLQGCLLELNGRLRLGAYGIHPESVQVLLKYCFSFREESGGLDDLEENFLILLSAARGLPRDIETLINRSSANPRGKSPLRDWDWQPNGSKLPDLNLLGI